MVWFPCTNKQKIFIKKCDVSIQNEVEDLVSDTFVKFGGCQILVNNAGIYGPKGTVENQDWDEWKKTMEIRKVDLKKNNITKIDNIPQNENIPQI